MSDQWIGLELRHLTALQAIADVGSFKGAARRLGYTPSAISQQIASLERIVGQRVIVREQGQKALGLTEAGRILLGNVNAIEARLSAAKTDIDALASGATGSIRIGAYESVGTRLLPLMVARFRSVGGHVPIEVEDATLDLDLLRMLERGALDLAFATFSLPPGPFETRLVLTDPWVLVVHADSPLAERTDRITADELAALPLVCFRAPRAIDHALLQLRDLDVEPRIVFRSDYNEIVQSFAAADLAVALLPRLAVNPLDERIAIVELGELLSPRQIAIAWHSEREPSDALEAFVAIAVEIGAELGRARPAIRGSSDGARFGMHARVASCE